MKRLIALRECTLDYLYMCLNAIMPLAFKKLPLNLFKKSIIFRLDRI